MASGAMRGLAAAVLAIYANASPLSDALDDNRPILDVLAAATPPPRAPSPYEARVFAACRKLHGLVDAHPMERALLALAPRARAGCTCRSPGTSSPTRTTRAQRKPRRGEAALALDFDAHRHFSVLVQMHVEQVRASFAKRKDGWVPDFARVLVFRASYGARLDARVRGELPGAALGRVPVPLLGHALDDDGDVARAAGSSLFWAGGCHARVRCFLEGLGPGVRPCGDTIDAAAFRAGLRAAAWALAPRGTMHATFMLAAAVRHGALPYENDFYEDEWSSEAYVQGDAYDYARPPLDRPKENPLDLSGLGGFVPDRKTGLIMCAAGAASTMLGVSLFFEKNLIRLGNVLLVAGAPIVVGPQSASRYVLNPAKLRGSLCFACGFMLILSGHPLLGIVVEIFGFLNLFGNLFPLFTAMFKNLPFVQQFASGGGGGPALPPDAYDAGGGGDYGY
ncbi:hypothetical protein JL720_1446 [Aureococcus anophagefferens]|nr:hypothetical protein JL720_1446 [Aureococcus anophagefferens]